MHCRLHLGSFVHCVVQFYWFLLMSLKQQASRQAGIASCSTVVALAQQGKKTDDASVLLTEFSKQARPPGKVGLLNYCETVGLNCK